STLEERNKTFLSIQTFSIVKSIKGFETKLGRRIRKGQVFLHIGGDRSFQKSICVARSTLNFRCGKRIIPVEEVVDVANVVEEFGKRFTLLKEIKRKRDSDEKTINSIIKKIWI